MKKTIYIFSDGELQRKDNTIYFSTTEGKKYLPVEDINELFVFGEVSLNKRFLEFVSQKDIDSLFQLLWVLYGDFLSSGTL